MNRRLYLLAISVLLVSGCSSPSPPVKLPKLCDVFTKDTLGSSEMSLPDMTITPPAPGNTTDTCNMDSSAIHITVTSKPDAEYAKALADLKGYASTPVQEYTMETVDKAFAWGTGYRAQAGLSSHGRFFDFSIATSGLDAVGYAQRLLDTLEEALTHPPQS
jgi:hypothetical protein